MAIRNTPWLDVTVLTGSVKEPDHSVGSIVGASKSSCSAAMVPQETMKPASPAPPSTTPASGAPLDEDETTVDEAAEECADEDNDETPTDDDVTLLEEAPEWVDEVWLDDADAAPEDEDDVVVTSGAATQSPSSHTS